MSFNGFVSFQMEPRIYIATGVQPSGTTTGIQKRNEQAMGRQLSRFWRRNIHDLARLTTTAVAPEDTRLTAIITE
jgi:hypothetical protein